MDVKIAEKQKKEKERNINEYLNLIQNLKQITLSLDMDESKELNDIKKSLITSTKYYLRGYTMGMGMDEVAMKKIRNNISVEEEFDFHHHLIDLDVSTDIMSSISTLYHLVLTHILMSSNVLDFEILFNVIENGYEFNIIYTYKEWCTDEDDKFFIEQLINDNLKNDTFVLPSIKRIILENNVLCLLDTTKDILSLR